MLVEVLVKGCTGNCSRSLGRTAVSGDMLIELGNSWFSAKTVEVVRHKLFYSYGVKLYALHVQILYVSLMTHP